MPDPEADWPARAVVIGTGTMGRGFAQLLATAGIPVALVDRTREIAEAAHRQALADIAKAEATGLMERGCASRFAETASAATLEEAFDPASAAGAVDLVMEAVSEDAAVKRQVFAAAEARAAAAAVVLSNTSAIPIATLSSFFARPERFLGAHWFNPPQWVPSVELIAGPETSPEILDRVEGLLRRLGKRPSRVGDDAGFVGNRIQFAMFREACLIVEEGLATIDEVDDVVRYSFGWRLPFLGPFLIADLAGLDVYEEVYRTLSERFGERFAVPAGLAELVSDGKLGAKSGEGFRRLDEERAKQITAGRDRAYEALGAVADAFQAETDA